MSVTTHFYMVIADLPPRSRELLRHLALQRQPFRLTDRALPPGGVSAWSEAFQRLFEAYMIERMGWGQAPRFQIKASARRALDGLLNPPTHN